MAASVLVFHRFGAPVESASLEPLLGALGGGPASEADAITREGVEGRFVRSAHRWGPRGEKVDMGASDSGYWWCFCEGRIDRWAGGAESSKGAGQRGVAVRLANRFEARGPAALADLCGSFAGGLVNVRDRRVVLFRDVLGNRSLSYSLDAERLVVASEEAGVLAAGTAEGLCEERIAQFFALRELTSDRSFFRAVKYVLPGTVLSVSPHDAHTVTFRKKPVGERLRMTDPQEYSEEFRRLLKVSVQRRLTGARIPAVLLSGGLDSGPIAASCRSVLGEESTLRSISWSFPKTPSCDEGSFVREANDLLKLQGRAVACDEAWPMAEPGNWPVHPTTPEQDAYRGFHLRSYQAAEEEGVDVLFTGMFGDHLYSDHRGWLFDAAGEGAKALVVAARRAYGAPGPGVADGRAGLEGLGRAVYGGLRSLPAFRGRSQTAIAAPAWLTDYARERLPAELPWPRTGNQMARPHQYLRAHELLHGHGMAVERFYARSHGLRLAYPFRDQELIEFLLRVPTTQLFDGQVRRPIVRKAFEGRLPASILRRRDKTTFEPILRRAFTTTGGPFAHRCLERQEGWRRWIKADALKVDDSEPLSSLKIMLTWLGVCWSLWLESRGFHETV